VKRGNLDKEDVFKKGFKKRLGSVAHLGGSRKNKRGEKKKGKRESIFLGRAWGEPVKFGGGKKGGMKGGTKTHLEKKRRGGGGKN